MYLYYALVAIVGGIANANNLINNEFVDNTISNYVIENSHNYGNVVVSDSNKSYVTYVGGIMAMNTRLNIF